MAAPMDHRWHTIIRLLDILRVVFTLCILQLLISVACNQHQHFGGFLLCRKCGFEIAKAHDLVSIPSTLAVRQRNDSFSVTSNHSVLIQLFKNPQGMYFEVVTCLDAEVERSAERYTTDSWFPGYTWSIANCPRCGNHVGWSFNAVSGALEAPMLKILSFVGLVLDKIMHEDDANNLIAIPKAYTS